MKRHEWKVGDRCRLIGPNTREHQTAVEIRAMRKYPSARFKTGTIVGIPAVRRGYDCSVVADDYPKEPHHGAWAAMFWQLAPLDEEAFMLFLDKLEDLAIEREKETAK